jgi:hypothetical protein
MYSTKLQEENKIKNKITKKDLCDILENFPFIKYIATLNVVLLAQF